MTRIRVDDVLRSKLKNFTDSIEICDENDKVIARVEPAPDLSDYEKWAPEFDEDELRRREQSDKWYTTAEVLARLGQLEGPK